MPNGLWEDRIVHLANIDELEKKVKNIETELAIANFKIDALYERLFIFSQDLQNVMMVDNINKESNKNDSNDQL